MSRDTIIDRVAKLLALAAEDSGGTPAERDTAAERAQLLMVKHAIAEGELAGRHGREALPGISREHAFTTVGYHARWRQRLLEGIARPVTVDVIYVDHYQHRKIWLVGRPDMIAYVRLVHGWLEPQLTGECNRALLSERERRHLTSAQARVFTRTFYEQAAQRIERRLREALSREVDCTALVRSDRAAIDDFYGDDSPKACNRQSARAFDYEAALAGDAAGQAVDLNPSNKVNAKAARELIA